MGKAEDLRLQKLIDEESIYNVSVEEIQTQEELEEEHFKEMFPDFEQDFADLDLQDTPKTQDGSTIPVKHSKSSNLFLFDSKKAVEIAMMFQNMASSFVHQPEFDIQAKWSKAFQSSFNAATAYVNLEKHIPNSHVDEIALAGFLFMSQVRINQIEIPLELGNSVVYDFYNDPNVNQAQHIKPVLLKYENALNKALSNWPEHTVLLNLSMICKRVISFPCTSPIMKLLVGLELLLVKSEDWESYSSKEFSLKAELADIVTLIVQWRKLELETWRELLAIEMKKCSENVAMQWFHLWKVIMGSFFSEIKVNLLLTRIPIWTRYPKVWSRF